VRTTPASIRCFTETGDLLVADEHALEGLADADVNEIAPLSPNAPLAIGIPAGVVGLAGLDALPIAIAALMRVHAMVVMGCLTTSDAHDPVSWNGIFLLVDGPLQLLTFVGTP
jgi:hypothetical protein